MKTVKFLLLFATTTLMICLACSEPTYQEVEQVRSDMSGRIRYLASKDFVESAKCNEKRAEYWEETGDLPIGVSAKDTYMSNREKIQIYKRMIKAVDRLESAGCLR